MQWWRRSAQTNDNECDWLRAVSRPASRAGARMSPTPEADSGLRCRCPGRCPISSGASASWPRPFATPICSRDLRRIAVPPATGAGRRTLCRYPWLIAHLPEGGARVLDAGSTLNHALFLDLQGSPRNPPHRHSGAGARLFLEKTSVVRVRRSARAAVQKRFYDVVICVSTLDMSAAITRSTLGRAVGRVPAGRFHDCRTGTCSGVEAGRPVSPDRAFRHVSVPRRVSTVRSDAPVDGGGGTRTDGRAIRGVLSLSSDGWQIATDSERASCEYVAWVAR